MLITNSNRYALTKGSYISEYLELTEEGRRSAGETVPKREQRRAWVQLAILNVEQFKALFEFPVTGSRVPSLSGAPTVPIDAI